MDQNAIIFNCIAQAAKVVFNYIDIAPGTYTATQIWAALNNDKKSVIKNISLNDDIYNYHWEDLGLNFHSVEDDGGISITVGSFSCCIRPDSVFEVLPKFAKIAGLPSATITAALSFTREESGELVPVCSFSMPCPGSKLAKVCANDPIRPTMNHVLLDLAGYLVASDGSILSVFDVDINISTADDRGEIMIPANFIKKIKAGEKVEIYHNGEKYIIKTAFATSAAGEDLAKYPNWRAVVNSHKFAPVATYSKKNFAEFQKTATKIAAGIPNNFFLYDSTEGTPRIISYNDNKQAKYAANLTASNVSPFFAGLSAAAISRVVMIGKNITMYASDESHSIIFLDDAGGVNLVAPCFVEHPDELGINIEEMRKRVKKSALNITESPVILRTISADEIAAATEDNAPATVENTTAAAPDVVPTDATADEYADAVAVLIAQEADTMPADILPALVADEIAAATEDNAPATVPGDFVAWPDEEEETAAAPTHAPRASCFIRAALWLHRYAAAIVAAFLPLFVLFVITQTEIPATAAAPADLVAATVATDTSTRAFSADVAKDTPAVAENTTAAAPAAVATVPGDFVAGQNIAPAGNHSPTLSPDDLAAIYAAYLAAAASPDCGPVLSSQATTAAATAAPAVDVATAPGDTLPAPVLGF